MTNSLEKSGNVPQRKNSLKIQNLFDEKRKKLILRGIFCGVLILHLSLVAYVGPMALMLMTIIIQVKCFAEIIHIGTKLYPVKEPPQFQFLSWYFLIAANYFCYGEVFHEHFKFLLATNKVLVILLGYHRFVSFCIYLAGIVWFVANLRRKYDKHQFCLLSYTHVALLLIVVQSYMAIKNTFQGLIWLIVPLGSVVCNDISAYIFGKMYGKTQLICVSPKKTLEGYIGAAVSTLIFGLALSYTLSRYSYFVCPVNYMEESGKMKLSTECEFPPEFQAKEYFFPSLHFCPFLLHSLAFSSFCSIIGPFGGFFASGFKRATKVKDFGQVIPGHGGVLDRFDCQFLMATFVNVYVSSFIKTSTPEKIFSKVLGLENEQQVQFFFMLKELIGGGDEHVEIV